MRQWDSYILDRNPQETRWYWLPELLMLHSVAAFKTFGHQGDDDESFSDESFSGESFWVAEGVLEGHLEQ